MVSIRRSEVVQAHEGVGAVRRPWERTGSVDVEQLLAWAYGVQMVDRFERAGLHAIEAAAAGFEPRGMSADGVGRLMEIEHLGCRIDQRGGVIVRDAVHPVALAVAQAVVWTEHRALVRQHALAGTRPTEWRPPERKARAAIWVKEWEVAMVEYQGPGRKGAHCPIIITWDARREAWGRSVWSAWRRGLVEVADWLSSRALGFVLTGPAAPAEPWRDCKAVAGKRAGPSPVSLDPAAESGGAPRGSSQRPHPQ